MNAIWGHRGKGITVFLPMGKVFPSFPPILRQKAKLIQILSTDFLPSAINGKGHLIPSLYAESESLAVIVALITIQVLY